MRFTFPGSVSWMGGTVRRTGQVKNTSPPPPGGIPRFTTCTQETSLKIPGDSGCWCDLQWVAKWSHRVWSLSLLQIYYKSRYGPEIVSSQKHHSRTNKEKQITQASFKYLGKRCNFLITGINAHKMFIFCILLYFYIYQLCYMSVIVCTNRGIEIKVLFWEWYQNFFNDAQPYL